MQRYITSQKNITVTGNTETKETISVAKGDKVSKSLFDLGKDDIKDTIKFSKSAKAKKLQIANFGDNDKLKYKGKTYTADDISGNKFDGISGKQIKLV